MPILGDIAEDEFQTTLQMTAPLAAIMVLQKHELPGPEEEDAARKRAGAAKRMKEKESVAAIEQSLGPRQRSFELT